MPPLDVRKWFIVAVYQKRDWKDLFHLVAACIINRKRFGGATRELELGDYFCFPDSFSYKRKGVRKGKKKKKKEERVSINGF